jgi:hypothetical protein
MGENVHSPSQLKQWLRNSGLGVFVYVLATIFTDAHFTGDTNDYVQSIVFYSRGQYYEFWEFGHALWRPLGWLLTRAMYPITRHIVGADLTVNATLVLTMISWTAGLVSVVTLAAILRRFNIRPWIINLTVVAFVVSHGFLNFAQTGAP